MQQVLGSCHQLQGVFESSESARNNAQTVWLPLLPITQRAGVSDSTILFDMHDVKHCCEDSSKGHGELKQIWSDVLPKFVAVLHPRDAASNSCVLIDRGKLPHGLGRNSFCSACCGCFAIEVFSVLSCSATEFITYAVNFLFLSLNRLRTTTYAGFSNYYSDWTTCYLDNLLCSFKHGSFQRSSALNSK